MSEMVSEIDGKSVVGNTFGRAIFRGTAMPITSAKSIPLANVLDGPRMLGKAAYHGS